MCTRTPNLRLGPPLQWPIPSWITCNYGESYTEYYHACTCSYMLAPTNIRPLVILPSSNLGRNMLSALNMSTFAVCIQFLVGIEVSSYPTLHIELRCLEQSDCDQQSDCPLLASGDRSERVRLRHDLPIAGM